MTFDPITALLNYHKAIDVHDIDLVQTMFAENAVYFSDGLGEVRGRDAIMAAMRKYFTGHPDHQSWDDEFVQTGPFSARSLWQLKATNRVTGDTVFRHGKEDIVFDNNGLIEQVKVVDETA